MTADPLWTTLQAVVWAFGLKAAVELRREFGRDTVTWTGFVWAVANCLLMDLALLARSVSAAPLFGLVAPLSGTVAAGLMGVMIRSLMRDLQGRVPLRSRIAWDRIGMAAVVLTGAVSATVPPSESVTAALGLIEGASWLIVSLWGTVALAGAGRRSQGSQLFRPHVLALAFTASFSHSLLTPLAWMTGWSWPAGLGPLAGTLFILTVVTSLYGTLLRVRGRRLADAERQVREAQEQLFSVEKLVAVGTLAAGAAHDFNNALTVIQGSAQLALDDPALTGQPRRDVETVVRAAGDAGAISRNLLTLARRQSSHQTTSLRDAVLTPLQALSKEFEKHAISVDTDVSEHSEVEVDGAAVSQVCLNLYLNARDAMLSTGGGTLQVSVRYEGAYALVSVRDTGTGIPGWFLPKLFQPLQTTKGDKGTGLGLAGSRAIIEAMGGTLTVVSEEGRGATFTIRIPHAPAASARLAG